jgi:replicative DNA helicase
MRAANTLDSVGGPPALRQLFSASPDLTHITDHCAIVVAKARQRAIYDVCRKHLALASGEIQSIDLYCEQVEADLLAATDPGDTGDAPQMLCEIISDVLPGITARQDSEHVVAPTGTATGVYELDINIGGGLDNMIYYVGARPAMGKSAFAGSVMLSIARGGVDQFGTPLNNGKAGVFVSFEMDKEQLCLRFISAESGVPFAAIKGERMTVEQWSSVLAAIDRLSNMPISICYMPGAHMTRIKSAMRREFRRLKHRFGADPGLGVVDYIGLVRGERSKNDTRENEIASISRFLMKLPKDFECPIICLAQLNRDLERRPDKRPQLADLRESGALEQDGYGVWFLYRDWYYNPETSDENDVEIIIAKSRNSKTGTVHARFEGDKMRFVSVNQALCDQCDDINNGLPLEPLGL